MHDNKPTTISGRLRNFPITFFAVVLGFAGFTLSMQKLEEVFSLSSMSSTILLYGTLCLLFAISAVYLCKVVFAFKSVIDEWKSPIKVNFFPLIAKILLVLSVVFLSRNVSISRTLWVFGTLLQFGFSLVIISTWINHTHFRIEHLTPAWFIPIVGFVIVPIAGVSHGFVELSWFAFSVGIVFWLALFIVVFYRMIFHEPIAQKLVPTLFILFAPPAIAFIAWVKLTGNFDPFGRVLFYFSLFLFALVVYQVRIFIKLKFYLSWWAYSFPLAAITLASVQMYRSTGSSSYKIPAVFTMVLLAITIGILLFFTIVHIAKKNICVEEE